MVVLERMRLKNELVQEKSGQKNESEKNEIGTV